jgi:hypothetical protein
MDFAEGTRLVRVVPDVPSGRPVSLVDDELGDPDDDELPVRNVVPVDGTPLGGDPVDVVIEDTSEHDTVVLGPLLGDETVPGEDEDPRAQIPAWEDIVFGVRRHR